MASPLFLAVLRCVSPRPGEIKLGRALYQPSLILGQVHILIWYHEPRWDPKTKGYSGTELAWIGVRATAALEVVFLGNLWGSCGLLLQNVRLGNNGTYGLWIHAVYPLGSTLKPMDKQQHEWWMEMIQVQVADVPQAVALELWAALPIHARDPVVLLCSCQAKSLAANFSWFQDGQDLLGQNRRRLDSNPVHPKDTGTYVCQACNPFSAACSLLLDLDVLCE